MECLASCENFWLYRWLWEEFTGANSMRSLIFSQWDPWCVRRTFRSFNRSASKILYDDLFELIVVLPGMPPKAAFSARSTFFIGSSLSHMSRVCSMFNSILPFGGQQSTTSDIRTRPTVVDNAASYVWQTAQQIFRVSLHILSHTPRPLIADPSELRNSGEWKKNDMFSCFDTIQKCDRQTVGQADRWI